MPLKESYRRLCASQRHCRHHTLKHLTAFDGCLWWKLHCPGCDSATRCWYVASRPQCALWRHHRAMVTVVMSTAKLQSNSRANLWKYSLSGDRIITIDRTLRGYQINPIERHLVIQNSFPSTATVETFTNGWRKYTPIRTLLLFLHQWVESFEENICARENRWSYTK